MKLLSIQNRMLLTIFVGLLSLIATHLLVEQFYVHSTLNTQKERLEGFANELSSFLSNNNQDIQWSNIHLSNPKFEKENSGLYAVVFNQEGKIVWTSPSVPSHQSVPDRPKNVNNNGHSIGTFASAHSQDNISFHRLSLPVLVQKEQEEGEGSSYNIIKDLQKQDKGEEQSNLYNILVYEDSIITDIKLESFKFAVWGGLGFSFILILLAQVLASRWSVEPFKHLSKDLNSIVDGKKDKLDTSYPVELKDIVSKMNSLIEHESFQSVNYRKSLDNLAHSLKTPLAVLRSAVENEESNGDVLKQEMKRQIEKMGDIVSYQLSLAGRMGVTSFTQPENLEDIAGDIVNSLEKIHASSGVLCEFEFEGDLNYKANKGDMQELLGNLLENAFKYCKKRVLLTMNKDEEYLHILVDDDGSGIPDENLDDVVLRGVRADQRVQGHGIGLAIVDDILRVYNGSMTVGHSIELGGACFHITLPLNN